MRQRLLVLLAAAALVMLACNPVSLVTQFLPENLQPTAEEPSQPEEEPTAAVAATSAPAAQGKITPAPTKAGVAPSSGNPLTDAANKMKGISKYRVEFQMIMGSTDKGKYTETPFMNFKGEVDGKNSHMSSTGGLMAMLAGDQNATIEFIEADGKSYVKGMGLMGIYDPKLWYVDDNNTGAGFSSMAKPDEFSDWTAGSKPGDFQKNRSESVDGQSCDVYVNNVKSLPAAAGMLGALGSADSKDAFSAIDKAEMSFWLCGDGFVHKFSLDFQGHDAKNTASKGALKVIGHTWDYNNASISVIAPKDAKTMPK